MGAAPHDRLGARQPRLALPRRARRGRAAALARRPRAGGGRAAADARVLPPHARQRQDGDGDRADDRVGLPDLPDRAAALPVLRRQGGVRLLRHQPQLAPAQEGRAAVHGREADRGRARGARADRPLRRGHEPRLHAHRRLGHLDGRGARGGRLLRPLRAGDRGALPRPLDRQGRGAGAAEGRRAALQGLRHLDLPPELRGLGQAALLADLARQAALRRPRGVAPADPRRGRRLRAAQRDPELRRRRGDGAAVRLRHDRRGDRLDHRRARLLHEPRRRAALHHLVPGADDAARPRQPGRRAARVPRPPARGLPRRACTGTGSRRRPATARPASATRSSRSARSWTCCEPDQRRRGARRSGTRRATRSCSGSPARCGRATTSRSARPTW